MHRFIVSFVVSIGLLSSVVNADILRIKPDAPPNYVVKKGDTLWDISAVYLHKPWHWPDLWKANPQIKNPHLIYPGDRLSLIFDALGNPRLVVNARQISKKLTPKARIQLSAPQGYIHSLPRQALEPFLKNTLLLDAKMAMAKAAVVAADSGFQTMANGDNISVGGLLSEGKYHVLRERQRIFDNTGVLLGTLYDKLAIAEVYAQHPQLNVSKAKITAAMAPVRRGDLFFEYEDSDIPENITFTKGAAVTGEIVAANNRQQYHGKWEIVVLNKGLRDQLKQGQLFEVMKQGQTVEVSHSLSYASDILPSTVNTPEFSVGELIVFKVYKNLSLALITKATQPIKLRDKFTMQME
jgi:hypothetical protein